MTDSYGWRDVPGFPGVYQVDALWEYGDLDGYVESAVAERYIGAYTDRSQPVSGQKGTNVR